MLLNRQRRNSVAAWNTGNEEEPYPNYTALAEGFRAEARSIARSEEVDDGLAALLDARGPYLLNVHSPHPEEMPLLRPVATIPEAVPL